MNPPDISKESFHPFLASDDERVQELELKEGAPTRYKVSEAVLSRYDNLFKRSLRIRSRDSSYSFLTDLKELMFIVGVKSYFYGSFVKYLLDCDRSYSSPYFKVPPKPSLERPGDIDVAVEHKNRHGVITKVLNFALTKIKSQHPGFLKDLEVHKALEHVQKTLFKAFWNKDGSGRYDHHRFAIFSFFVEDTNSKSEFSIDFVVSEVALPQLFDIEGIKLPMEGYLQGSREIYPEPENCIPNFIKWVNQRASVNPSVVIDEVSCMKLMKLRRKGIYCSFNEDAQFLDVLNTPKLHRTQPPKSLKEILDRAIQNIQSSTLTLTLFFTQFRLFYKKGVPLSPLSAFKEPKNWQEKLINWLQKELPQEDFEHKMGALAFALLFKLVKTGSSHIRYFDDQIRVEFPVGHLSLFLFLSMPQGITIVEKELREILDISEEESFGYYLSDRLEKKMILFQDFQEKFIELYKLGMKLEIPFSLKVLQIIYKSFQKGWISEGEALSHSAQEIEYDFNDPSLSLGFKFEILLKHPTLERARAFFSSLPLNEENLRKASEVRSRLSYGQRQDFEEFFIEKGILAEPSQYKKTYFLLKEWLTRFNSLPYSKFVFQGYLLGCLGKQEVLKYYNPAIDYFTSLNQSDSEGVGLDLLLKKPDKEKACDYLKTRPFTKEQLKEATGLTDVEALYFEMKIDGWIKNSEEALKHLIPYIKEGLFLEEIEDRLKKDPSKFTLLIERSFLVEQMSFAKRLAKVYLEAFPQTELKELFVFLNPAVRFKTVDDCKGFLKSNRYKLSKSVVQAIAICSYEDKDLFLLMSKHPPRAIKGGSVYQSEPLQPCLFIEPHQEDRELFITYYLSVAKILVERSLSALDYDYLFNILLSLCKQVRLEHMNDFTNLVECWIRSAPQDPELYLRHFEWALKEVYLALDHSQDFKPVLSLLWCVTGCPSTRAPLFSDQFFETVKKLSESDKLNDLIRALYMVGSLSQQYRKGKQKEITELFNRWVSIIKSGTERGDVIEAIIPFYFGKGGFMHEIDKGSKSIETTFDALKVLYNLTKSPNVKALIVKTMWQLIIKLLDKKIMKLGDPLESALSFAFIPYLSDCYTHHNNLLGQDFLKTIVSTCPSDRTLHQTAISFLSSTVCQII